MINKENLLKLAEFLWQRISQDQFDMGNYRANIEEGILSNVWFESYKDCGTIGCALGWCPFVEGLEPINKDFTLNNFVSFLSYSKRIFGGDWTYTPTLRFIFDGDWENIDNTVEGAVQRILYVCKFYEPKELSEEEIKELFEISKDAVNKYKDINPAEFFGERLSNPFKQ